MKPAIETLFDHYRRKGDVAALGKVFDRTSADLLRVALHVASSAAEAEDLVQETYLTAIAKADTYDGSRPLTPWLLGILRNHARRIKRKRRPAAMGLPGDPLANSSEGMPIGIAWNDRVSTAVGALPEPYRQVLVLRICHNNPPAEIAILLNREPATVRSQIHRGLERLREALPDDPMLRGLVVPPAAVGLAAVRRSVLANATASATATGAVATSLLIGGIAVSKRASRLFGKWS